MQLKFRQFSLETGILADNIVLLPQNGMSEIVLCVHFSGFCKQFRPLLTELFHLCCYS